MNIIFVFLTLFFSTLLQHILTLNESDELEDAYDDCQREFNISNDEFDSSEEDLVCFNTCVAKKVGVIKNGQINVEKLFNYLIDVSDDSDESTDAIDTEDDENAKAVIKSCVNKIPYVTDDCRLFNEVRDCIFQGLE